MARATITSAVLIDMPATKLTDRSPLEFSAECVVNMVDEEDEWLSVVAELGITVGAEAMVIKRLGRQG